MTSADPVAMAGRFAGRAPHSDVVDEFQRLVAQRLGRLALAIFDARMEGRNMKDLVGLSSIGTPSAFLLKREIRAIKQLAQHFAQRTGDSTFAAMVEKAMDAEKRTVKRKAAVAAK
jgi:hypothetical protein